MVEPGTGASQYPHQMGKAVSYTHLDVYKRQVHEGAAVRQMEKRGIQTNIGNLNREIRAANRLMKSIRQLIHNLKGWIAELGEKRKALLAQKAAEEATLLPNLLMKYMDCLLYTSRCV